MADFDLNKYLEEKEKETRKLNEEKFRHILDKIDWGAEYERRDILEYLETYTKEEVEQIYERVMDDKDIPADEVKEGMPGIWLQTDAGKAYVKGFGDAYENFMIFLEHDAYEEHEIGRQEDWYYPYKKLLHCSWMEDAVVGNMDIQDGNIVVIEDYSDFYQEGISKNPDVAYLKGVEMFEEVMNNHIENATLDESDRVFPDEKALEDYDEDWAKKLLQDFLTLMREETINAKNISRLNEAMRVSPNNESLAVLQKLVPMCFSSNTQELNSLTSGQNADETIKNIRNNGSKELNELLDIAVIKHEARFHDDYASEPPISKERNQIIQELKSSFDPNDYNFYHNTDIQIIECVMGAENSIKYMAPAFGMFSLRGLDRGNTCYPTNLEINYAWNALEKEAEINKGLSVEDYANGEICSSHFLRPQYNPYSIKELGLAASVYDSFYIKNIIDFTSFLESEFCVGVLRECAENPKYIASNAIDSVKQSVFEKLENVVEQSKISDSVSEWIRDSLYEAFENIGIENLNIKKEKCDDFQKVQAVVSEVSRCVESQISQVTEGVRNMQLKSRPIRRAPLDMIREELEQPKRDEFEIKKNLVAGALESCANILNTDNIEKISKSIDSSRIDELYKLDDIFQDANDKYPYDAEQIGGFTCGRCCNEEDFLEQLNSHLWPQSHTEKINFDSKEEIVSDIIGDIKLCKEEKISEQNVQTNKNSQKM